MEFEKTTQIIFTAGAIAGAAVFPAGEAVVYSQNGVYGIAGETLAHLRMMDIGPNGYRGPRTFENLIVVAST